MIGEPKIEKVNFREQLMQELRNRAERLYSSDLEYHNFEHALMVLECARDIMEICKEEGLEFDADVVEIAALFHDAAYQEDLAEGFRNKEEYSAFLAEKHLKEVGGFSEEFIQKVKNAIIGTDPFIEVGKLKELSVEAKILRVADVARMAGSYEEFMVDSFKLKSEWERMNNKGNEITLEEWKKKAEFVIGRYLEGEINLTKYYYNEENGESVFREKIKNNLDKFLKSSDEDFNRYGQSK